MGNQVTPSYHERALHRIVDRICAEEPEAATGLYWLLGLMKDGRFPDSAVDSVVQKHSSPYDVYDAYCMLQFHARAVGRQMVFHVAPVGRTPVADRLRDENNLRLKGLPAPFAATFHGGTADSDGILRWDEPIAFQFFSDDEDDRIVLPPRAGGVPLEVGVTKGSRTILHLVEGRGLARWPYEHDCCYIYAML
jgi:hypothetical protein